MTIEEIASKIKRTATTRAPVLIAIEGYGGSGKTTFAEKLGDDFIVKEKLAEPSWDKGGFDRDRPEKQVLKPLREGAMAVLRTPNFGTCGRQMICAIRKNTTLSWRPILYLIIMNNEAR